MRSKSYNEIKVGGVIIAALAIMIGAVFTLSGKQKLFGGKTKYKILFNSTNGLYEGDPVLLTGVEVGNVSRIGFPEEIEKMKILVEIEVTKDVSSRIRKDTRAKIGAASLIYGKLVELTMGSSDEPIINEGEFIKTYESKGYSAIVDSTSSVLENLGSVFTKLDRGDGLLGLLLNEPLGIKQVVHNLSLSTQRLSSLLTRLDNGKSPLGSLLSDTTDFHQTVEDFKTATSDLKDITTNLRGNKSVLGKLINDSEYGEALTNDLRSTFHSLASITAKIDTGKGSIGGLINDKGLYYGLENVVLGIEKSSLTKWIIRGRRKSGEKVRDKFESEIQAEDEIIHP
jgi:phospholipid/cholesterol/gamma-HCH transport system substrate-binding protein